VERGGLGGGERNRGERAWESDEEKREKKSKQVLGVRDGWRGCKVAGRRPRAWKARRVPTAAEAVVRWRVKCHRPGMLPRGEATVSSSRPCSGGQGTGDADMWWTLTALRLSERYFLFAGLEWTNWLCSGAGGQCAVEVWNESSACALCSLFFFSRRNQHNRQ
jgi:hypothetical protein